MRKIIIWSTIKCVCGETWIVLADDNGYDFEIEKVKSFILRTVHRMYECKMSPVLIKELR